MASALSDGMSKIRFRRVLWGDTADMLHELKDLCKNVVLTDQEDRCSWLLNKTARFTIRSLYLTLKSSQGPWPHRKLWYAKIPLKIKVFLWLVFKNSVLTRDNLAKRNWNGNKKCSFCDSEETLNHLFYFLSFGYISLENYLC